LTLKFN